MHFIVDCGYPKIPNGNYLLSRLTYGASGKCLCDQGYELDGNCTIQCNEFGHWSASNGTCKPKGEFQY